MFFSIRLFFCTFLPVTLRRCKGPFFLYLCKVGINKDSHFASLVLAFDFPILSRSVLLCLFRLVFCWSIFLLSFFFLSLPNHVFLCCVSMTPSYSSYAFFHFPRYTLHLQNASQRSEDVEFVFRRFFFHLNFAVSGCVPNGALGTPLRFRWWLCSVVQINRSHILIWRVINETRFASSESDYQKQENINNKQKILRDQCAYWIKGTDDPLLSHAIK